jgi:hypothetical protein
MNNSTQNKAETKELNYGQSSGSSEGAETTEGASVPMKDPDTMVSMIVLLLTCLALAALAHAVV